jgi:hypothetical protein
MAHLVNIVWIVALIAAIFWIPAVVGVALVAGRVIKARDRQVPR